MRNTSSRFHSVILDEPACKGCTICITTCPVEAIRVRGGKAYIIEEKCIDCGECIRRCPSHAKKARPDSLARLADFDYTIALPAPSLYTQFSEKYSIGRIRQGLIQLGFSRVFDVAAATHLVSEATASYVFRPDVPKPVISSSCPVIIKLIQVRFPTLMEHLLPVIPPVEAAARLVASAEKGKKTGIFFISPCASKITAARSPLGYEESRIDGVLAISDIYLPLLNVMRTIPERDCSAESGNKASDERLSEEAGVSDRASDEGNLAEPGSEGYGWGCSLGEIQALTRAADKDFRWVSADGIDQVIKTLEAIEDGKLNGIDYAELSACTYGCAGGPLTVTLPALAAAVMRERKSEAEQRAQPSRRAQQSHAAAEARLNTNAGKPSMNWTDELMPRPSLLLDADFERARAMMEEMEALYEELPGLDCGSCGAPNCHALAEDIVRGRAAREDCILVLREQYEKLIREKRPL